MLGGPEIAAPSVMTRQYWRMESSSDGLEERSTLERVPGMAFMCPWFQVQGLIEMAHQLARTTAFVAVEEGLRLPVGKLKSYCSNFRDALPMVYTWPS